MKPDDTVEFGPWAGFEVIHVYTRAQALADGVLVESELQYDVLFRFRGRPGIRSGLRKQRLKLHSGPGDEGEHVITIMLPEED